MAAGMALFNRIWWNFHGENPKMAARMVLFRSVLIKFFTVRIQEWQPIWPFFDRFWWNFLRWKSKNGSRNGIFSIGCDEIFWRRKSKKGSRNGPLPIRFHVKDSVKSKNANGHSPCSVRLDGKKLAEIVKWQAEWPFFDQISWNSWWWKSKNANGNGPFSITFDEKNTVKLKNGRRNGHFSIRFHEIFYGENPKMAAGMVLFRSDLMKNFVEIQEWQPEWPFFDRFWWNFLQWKSKNGNRNGPFSLDFDEIFYGENPRMATGMALLACGRRAKVLKKTWCCWSFCECE